MLTFSADLSKNYSLLFDNERPFAFIRGSFVNYSG